MLVMVEQHRTDREGLVIPFGSWPLERNAPGGLEIVRRFVNTQSAETGAELLRSSGDLRRWVHSEGVAVRTVAAADLDRAHHIRRVLRDSIESRDEPLELDRVAKDYDVRLDFGAAKLIPQTRTKTPGAHNLFCALLIATWTAVHDGTWNRMIACSNEDCRWIVYDNSKSKTVQWCSDKVCGGRARAQRYRDRQRQFR
jgi:predicted RNA-binding Zn ribbon-like protein